MINSKFLRKIFSLSTEGVKQEKKERVKSSSKKGVTKNPKPYPIPEEDSFIPPDDDSAEVKYKIKEKKS